MKNKKVVDHTELYKKGLLGVELLSLYEEFYKK